MTGSFKYRTFISYSHADTKWATWLLRRLESYHVPARFHGRTAAIGEVGERIAPVFRDRDELPTTSDLGETIRAALKESATLVVICSRRSAKSRWVQQEIIEFKRLGRAARVFAFIVDGEPKLAGTDEDCFSPALRFAVGPDGSLTTTPQEQVAADARHLGDGKEDAFIRLVAGLIGVGFDDLRQRELRRRNRRLTWIAAGLAAGIAFSGWLTFRAIRAEKEQRHLREIAQTAQAAETKQRQRAEAQELATRRRSYASDMNGVQHALAANNLARARELLNRQRPQPGELDLRGWEWRYLWQKCQSNPHDALPQQSEIWSLAASSDGKLVAISSRTAVAIWDLPSRTEIARFDQSHARTARVAFSPRQPILAFSEMPARSSGPVGRRIRLWDASARQFLAVEFTFDDSCMGLTFSADGQSLIVATGGEVSRVSVWSVATGARLASYPVGAWDYVGGMESTPFAANVEAGVAAVAPGPTIQLLDLTRGTLRWSQKAGDESIKALAISPNGQLIASAAGFQESSIRLWDAASGREISRLVGHSAWVAALVFWPDGKTLASAGSDQTVRVWDLSTPESVPPPRVLKGHEAEVWRLALLPDQKTLLSSAKDGTVFLWDTETIERNDGQEIVLADVANARFAADSRSIFIIGNDGRVTRRTGEHFRLQEPILETGLVKPTAVFSRDCRILATGTADGTLALWDLAARTLVKQAKIDPGWVAPRSFLTTGKTILIQRADGTLFELDLAVWQSGRSWKDDAKFFREAAVTQDLAAADGTNIGDYGSAISPDLKLVATAEVSAGAGLYEAATGRPLHRFGGFLLGVHSVAFSPDGNVLAAGAGGNEAVKLFNLESREELINLTGLGSLFVWLQFSPDGSTIGARNAKGLLHFWRAPSWTEIDRAEGKPNAR